MADPQPLVAVLAAGRATRFGGGKLDADCAGKPLGQWALDAVAAAGLEPGVIVTGPDAPQFAQAALGWSLLENSTPEAGLGTSVAIAACEAQRRRTGLLVLLADMPLVDPAHLRSLAASAGSAASRYPRGHVGVPACIAAPDLGKATQLEGDSGAGALLASLPDLQVLDADAQSLLDVDREDDLAAVRQALAKRG